MFRAYERLPDELEQLPEEVSITLIMFSQRIHFIEEDPESHRLSVVTLADEMLESPMDNIPYELSITNRKQFFELMRGQFFEHFFNSLSVDDQNQSCMNSALYFFSNYVAQYEMKSVVAIIAASSSTFGFFLPRELSDTQGSDNASGAISKDFETFFFDDELREQMQFNAFFVG